MALPAQLPEQLAEREDGRAKCDLCGRHREVGVADRRGLVRHWREAERQTTLQAGAPTSFTFRECSYGSS